MTQPCGLCGEPAVDAIVHPCCTFWVTQPEWARSGCVACSESRRAARGQTRRSK